MNATISGLVQPHNQRPASVWSSGGADYDRISRGIADSLEHCVLRLDPAPGERILDLATGTGWTSRLVARRGAQVVGVDIADDLLGGGPRQARREGLAIDYRTGDAEALPFADAAFDAVVSTVGVMFASRPEAAAAELARVTQARRPDRADHLGARRQRLPDVPGDEGVHGASGRAGAAVAVRVGPHGTAHASCWRRSFDLRFEEAVSFYREPSAEAAWDTFSTGYGPTRMLATSLPEDRREALRRDFVAFHDGFATELGITVPRAYWLTLGRRR